MSSKKETLQIASKRFIEKVVVPLKDELHEISWDVWIRPIEMIDFRDKKITLYHENARWVFEHYGKRIKEKINKGAKEEITIEITNKK